MTDQPLVFVPADLCLADIRRLRPLDGLRDLKARVIIRERIARLMLGNFGDAKAIGEGVFEMRVVSQSSKGHRPLASA
jgi:putative component of toxin-antitoxin plasmid stabilization module